ncbi:MAG: hypothetical protein QW451_00740 [Candidatus Aenigmatarchaeota archaeon]
MFGFRKKKVEPLPPPPQEPKQEPKIEISKLPLEQKVEVISAQIEALNERVKNIERMVEEIYKMAKS